MEFDSSSFLDNSIDAKSLRKSEKNLVTVGFGIMIFGVWNVIKTFSVLFLNQNAIVNLIKGYTEEDLNKYVSDSTIFTFIFIWFILFMSVGVIARLYIGCSAIFVGRYKRKKSLYIPITIIYIICSLGEFYYDFNDIFFNPDSISTNLETRDSPIVTLIIEITSMVMMVELVVLSRRIRRIRREAEKCN